ncbi:nuclear transport factor 2 family protein [Halobiforma nitratireducens]|uniref:Nuclear transport factor 2 n=1 Tax=Halobiforma nitratireducens JCM 10879 TaxID=1227454 RepID=M0MFB3_9EURY|nr:nuclear transport factor 2 family protein [Halobiforma nitratireducens]EMA44427.1 nuclear transport factor 2 [Halobiforma nitratireducens JCM 10879]
MADDTTELDTGADPDSDPDPETMVREYYELVDAEEYDDLVALFTPDVRYERPGQGAIEGREALRRFYETGRPLEEGSHEVHDVVVDSSGGDVTVAVRGTFSGRQGEETVEFGFADFHALNAERDAIARRYTFTDRDEV